MRKSFRILLKVSMGIGVSAVILYFFSAWLYFRERDRVWAKVEAYAEKYSVEHPEVTQEQLNSWTYALYDEALRREGLYRPPSK